MVNGNCELSSSETTVYSQSVHYNDTVSSNQWGIYMKLQQARTGWEVEGGGGEREREREKERESNRLGEWEMECWMETEMAWVRNDSWRH
jgi:hypothetical protein